MLELLFENGADLDIQNNDGDTPLHYLCNTQFITTEILEFLVRKGVDLNRQNNDGNTSLHFSLRNTQIITIEFLEFLVENGADLNRQNNDGATISGFLIFHDDISDEIKMFLYRNLDSVQIYDETPQQSFNSYLMLCVGIPVGLYLCVKFNEEISSWFS